MPTDPRIGVVGLGGIGTLHAETLDGHVAGGADLNPSAREAFRGRFNAPTYDSHCDLLATSDLDGLIVTTPNRYHRDVVVDALAVDIPVLVEKPLADTLANARDIAAAADESDAFCMTGFHNRYSAPVAVLRRHIEDSRLGRIRHVEANYVRRRGVPGRGSWFTDDDVAGGGALIDVGVHVLDLALHFLDHDDDLTVLGTTRTAFGDRGEDYAYLDMWGADDPNGTFDVEDSVSAFVRAGNGASASLEVAWGTNRQPTHSLFVRGTEGGAELDIEAETLTLYRTGRRPTDHHEDVSITVGEYDAYRAEQHDFLAAVSNGSRPSHNTVSEALRVQRVVDGIYQSAESGVSVSVTPYEVTSGATQ